MSLCVFDILPDGTTQIPTDTDLCGPGVYRWWHFDLSDPSLESWCATHLPAIPASALLQPETRPRCDAYERGLILNLRGINLNEGQNTDEMVSVRMWLEEAVIVTVRVRPVFALEDIRQSMVAGSTPTTTAAFIEDLVARLTRRIQEEIAKIAERAEFYEDVLEDETTPPPTDLSVSRRRVIRLRRYLEPQRSALTTLANFSQPLIPETQAMQLRELANRTTIVVEELDALRERLVTVQDEHDLYVARKQASHSMTLSIAAGVFLPLGFLTGLFGVNVGGMPGMQNPWAFTVLCLCMLALGALMIVVLRRMRWL